MAKIWRVCTATLAAQVATLTAKAGLPSEPDHLSITGATITFAANAAQEINTLDEYILTLERRSKT